MARARSTRPKPNDPCECGSGLKRKHCHHAPAGQVRKGAFFLPIADPLTFELLVWGLKHLPHHPANLLVSATKYAAERIPIHRSDADGIRATDCAVLALAAICAGDGSHCSLLSATMSQSRRLTSAQLVFGTPEPIQHSTVLFSRARSSVPRKNAELRRHEGLELLDQPNGLLPTGRVTVASTVERARRIVGHDRRARRIRASRTIPNRNAVGEQCCGPRNL